MSNAKDLTIMQAEVTAQKIKLHVHMCCQYKCMPMVIYSRFRQSLHLLVA